MLNRVDTQVIYTFLIKIQINVKWLESTLTASRQKFSCNVKRFARYVIFLYKIIVQKYEVRNSR